MQIKIFTIPVSDTGVFTEELNRFLRANKVLEVESQLVSNERGSMWCFCVKYVGLVSTLPINDKPRTDFKSELDEATFKIFSHLREIRKQLATEEAVPAYAIFTDAELSSIAKLNEISLKSLSTIKGIGEKKLEKYGSRIINIYNNNIKPDETGGTAI